MSWILPPVRLAPVVLALGAHAAAQDPAPPRVPVPSHAELASALAEIARTSDGAATVVRLGASRAGRAIEALRVARGPDAPGRPAILVVGALDPEMAWTSGLVLDHARTLLARAAGDERARTLLETTTLWLVPRANPDATLVSRVGADDPLLSIRAVAGGSGRGSGGMASKLSAAA